MKTTGFIFRSMIFVSLLLTACHSNDQQSTGAVADSLSVSSAGSSFTEGTYAVAGNQNAAADESPAEEKSREQLKDVAASPVVTVKIPEKIKKTADINLTVDDYKKARAALESIVKSGSGYIGSENEQNSTYNISNSIVIRVANKDFDKMVSSIAGIEGHVNSKNIYVEDVTAQFVDMTARLKSKKEVENRYQALLQKALKVSDILEIEEQLRIIREEIEAKEGELKYLNDQVAYSTINLNFHQDFEFTPTDKPAFFGRMGTAFGNGWNGFLSFLVGIVYAWPLWLVLAIGGYVLYRFIRKQTKK